MRESQRRAYLDAMGFDVWVARPVRPEPDQLVLQAGNGQTLLLCEEPEQTARRIAGDIARALDQDIVWAWPDIDGQEGATSLEEAIGQYLFTRVVVFGAALANRVRKGEIPPVIGSASMLVTDSLGEMEVRGSAKQTFWEQLSLFRVN
jgi:hypothetical protein